MFYLKYRPQKFNELDLKSVRERLINVLSKKTVPHAFLFSGPRGAGKTSAARIVAKVVNCRRKQKLPVTKISSEINSPPRLSAGLHAGGSGLAQTTDSSEIVTHENFFIEPCNQCSSCKSITQGRHLDILEIDAASNRGIDQIRDLRNKIALAAGSAKYKVYIIDEVHMLTKEAFNAILKTLEEPPKHAMFILATTEPHKLPETVKSRCVEVVFPKATEKEIIRSLERVIKGEGLKVEDGVLNEIARLSDGSFRDATKLLEEAIPVSASLANSSAAQDTAGKKGKITVDKILAIRGGGRGIVNRFIEYLEKKDASVLLKYINEQADEGIDPSWLTKAALDRLHEKFLAHYGIGSKSRKFAGNKAPGQAAAAGYKLSKEELITLMRLLEQAAREEKSAVIAQMPLELAVISWCAKKEV